MYVLGVNAGPQAWHDSAACIVDSVGGILSFVEEERLSRSKHALNSQPALSVSECLSSAGLTSDDIDVMAVGWDVPKVYAKHGRVWEFSSRYEICEAFLSRRLKSPPPEIVFIPHHVAHAASAFWASPFPNAGVLVVDGNGEEESVSIYKCQRGLPMRELVVAPRRNSLGIMYDAVSELLGFSFLEAGKTMGLACYGRGLGRCDDSLFASQDGEVLPSPAISGSVDTRYRELKGLWKSFLASEHDLSEVPRDTSVLDKSEQAVRLAWRAQSSLEEAVANLAEVTRAMTGWERLCISGGVALNCSANGRLPGPVFVPPFPHDAGVAVGAAWSVCPPDESFDYFSPYLGMPARRATPVQFPRGMAGRLLPYDPAVVAERLTRGQIGAIIEGRFEAGPRALCHRSIIASASSADMVTKLNAVKGREVWRPFSPVVKQTGPVGDDLLCRYMLGARLMDETFREVNPAAVHADGTSRLQILRSEHCTVASDILSEYSYTASPALINTSLNARGEPIAGSTQDGIDCAFRLGLDFVVIGQEGILEVN